MPSPDDTFFPIKRMHRLLAASSVILLAVTVWMIVADHRRPWKVYQRESRDRIDSWGKPTFGQSEPSWGKRLLRLPILDAFGRTLSVEQIWLPELTIDYHFRQVARFDRCTTCHGEIDKSLPGTAAGKFPHASRLSVQLATPRQPPEAESGATGGLPTRASSTLADKQPVAPAESKRDLIKNTYGLALAERGILDPRLPTIELVLPKTAAAQAMLAVGDVIVKVNGRDVPDRRAAEKCLLDDVTWGKPLAVEIRRGLVHPHASHPRLDLFVGPNSPHPMTQFGCTICHEGQGSATDFNWASHTPNDLAQRAEWRRRYGWSANPHWDHPMLPARFAESRCLACHHDVVDLEPSRKFPDPPAPRLVAGYHLVRQYGCFGCHEIKGIDDSGRRIGPDMRLEPGQGGGTLGGVAGRNLPGTMRRVGPSLRDVADRMEAGSLSRWIANPAAERPATRMPRLYGLHEHLEGKELADTQRFEAVELRAISQYLLASSRSITPLDSPAGVTEPPSVGRGKRLFQTSGCLACHKHRDLPEGQSVQGPDLSGLATKITAKNGPQWLADWIRDPARHAPRTKMPRVMLEPVPLAASGEAEKNSSKKTRMTDPAADIAAWLLGAKGPVAELLPPVREADLDELVLMHLRGSFTAEQAGEYVKNGIPESRAENATPLTPNPSPARGEGSKDTAAESKAEPVAGDARLLVGPISMEKKLQYLGRRTIRRRGCFGCHDVDGLEDAQPIGPALSDWGRKQVSLLAFEQIHSFIQQGKADGAGQGSAAAKNDAASEQGRAGQGGSARDNAATTDSPTTDEQFFLHALQEERREGFAWQKLRAPRSFDYQKARKKGYLEQLTMGRFTLTDPQREAIITFVLGLVAAPPAERYVYHPDRRQQAIVEGRKLIEQFACAECHALEMERWTLQYDPAGFRVPPPAKNFDFLCQHVSPETLAASRRTDLRGLGRVELVGMPRLDAKGKLQEDEDDDGRPTYGFTLWEPAAVAGQVWPVGGAEVLVEKSQLIAKRPAEGGAYARLLFPIALAEAKAAGSTASAGEAWGWVPPALAHEGRRVQPAWLYDYLLEPGVIRPASVLRMPKYNLSPSEAGRLTDYFAALSDAEFPYVARRPAADRSKDGSHPPARLDDALRIVLDRKTYCAKCHLIGDYSPGGEVRTILAPNLREVGRRVRPEYLRRWLADPRSVLPYTAMPVNFPPQGGPLGQDLYRGSSREQLDAVLNLLLDYDQFMSGRASVRGLVEQGPTLDGAPGQSKR